MGLESINLDPLKSVSFLPVCKYKLYPLHASQMYTSENILYLDSKRKKKKKL